MNGLNNKKQIYCISGLGADERLFSKLELPPSFELSPLSWISAKENETLQSYAERMSMRITDENPILMGVSFGGMVAVEIAKLIHVEKIILISSIKTRFEKPLYFRIVSSLSLNKVISLRPTKFLRPFENFNIGVKTEEDRKLADEYHRNYDEKFGDWAIDRIVNWNNETYPPDLFHIHGSNDHILPVRYVKPDVIIKDGGHLMVFNRAKEISEILKNEI